MKKIFLIDDDSDDRDVFQAALNSIELQSDFVQAENGEQALAMVSNKEFKAPDIIFLDLNMPKMGGLEFLQKIRLIPEYKQVQILIYTTSSLQKDKDSVLAAGANGVITKHYSFDALCDELTFLFK
ncbi:response regulator [Sphingobacteriaceae bacterium]|nr:response regulator [Sphingobacteriaceae bacterium]